MSFDFSFVFDKRIMEILERDYAELQQLDPQTSPKSVIVISGGIIEGLLFDALVASGKWTFEEACNNVLGYMIGQAKNKRIITEDRLTDATRKYRNLIHPGREIKDNVVFEETDAALAKLAVDVVIREVRNWAISEQNQRNIRRLLTQLYQDQIEFLQLFSIDKPTDSNQYEHPFLKYSVYISIWSLAANGILTVEKDGKHKEIVRLNPEAVEPIEESVIKQRVKRNSIVLDDRNIAGSGASGSGAPPNQRFL
ncbi:MAG: hypothetical protein PHX53_10655 [Syntrophales bacterium]|nr:hypothetical protein [Syntrophales bacterium]